MSLLPIRLQRQQSLKTQNKLTKLEIMYQHAIYVYIS